MLTLPTVHAPPETAAIPAPITVPDALVPLVIDVQHVRREFGSFVAVDDLTLAVPQHGAIVGIIGPSGSGKTTTIRMITGALRPTSGHLRVLGEEPARFRRSTRERLGYLPQSFSLYPDLTARENVDFVASLFGMLWRRRRRRVSEVLEQVELSEVRNRRAGRLSGGMQRRLELACALVNDPSLLVLDEPTSGLDPLLRTHIWNHLRELRDGGRTILVTTQVVSEAERCDAVALMSDGQLIAVAPPQELRRQAVGGDVVEIDLGQPIDLRPLIALPFVRHVNQLDQRRIQVTVDLAASATPDLLEAIDANGGTVASVREVKPTFDEVFALLVGRFRDGTRPTGDDQRFGTLPPAGANRSLDAVVEAPKAHDEGAA